MTPRDRNVLSVVMIVVLIGGFWFMLLNPRRHEGKKLSDQVAAAQLRLDTARQTEATAEQAQKQYDGDYATVARLGKAVPVDDDVPSLVYQLEHAANRSKVDFRSIKLAAGGAATSTAQTNAAQAAALGNAQKNPAGSSPPSGSGSATGTPAANPSTPAAANATQTGAAGLPPGASVGAAGFPTMPFDFNFTGSFFRLEGFLRVLDRFTVVNGDKIRVRGRLLTVDGISLSASAKGFPKMSAQIHATAYLLPSDEGLTNGATSAAPAANTATTSSNGSTASPAATAAITGGAG